MFHQQSCNFKGGCGPHHRGPWGRGQRSWGGPWSRQTIPANITETDTAFELELLAPGRTKEDFRIGAKDDVLTVSWQKGEEAPGDPSAHSEWSLGSFERSFRLNGKVLTESITAQYADGILRVTLPKNPETNKPAQEVKVS